VPAQTSPKSGAGGESVKDLRFHQSVSSIEVDDPEPQSRRRNRSRLRREAEPRFENRRIRVAKQLARPDTPTLSVSSAGASARTGLCSQHSSAGHGPSLSGRAEVLVVRKRRLRILVFEPDERVRSFLADALNDIAEVRQAKDASEALESLSECAERPLISCIDVAIVDCAAHGLDVIRMISARDPSVPVIATSAAADASNVAVEALRSGAGLFLKKPFGLQVLLTAVERVSAAFRRAGPHRWSAES
jgi:CheY-like chemotaxis protein